MDSCSERKNLHCEGQRFLIRRKRKGNLSNVGYIKHPQNRLCPLQFPLHCVFGERGNTRK
jgi:hypothetical protein